MSPRPLQIILCNGADRPALQSEAAGSRYLKLDYRPQGPVPANVRIELPRFVDDLLHLPPRLLDLLEIASYVYCADRRIVRGQKNAVEFTAWARRLEFQIRVRDHAFWRQPKVAQRLGRLLQFLAGDELILFNFQSGHATPPTSLFDSAEIPLKLDGAAVALFSGGADSLAGVAQQLATTSVKLLLVSHRSGSQSTGYTQDSLVHALQQKYSGRLQHYKFHCGLTGSRAEEETQRTRFFLYTCIAFVLARSASQSRIEVYENGITSLNFPERQDLMNARASRTTHPKTICSAHG